jgi:4'-phosphopantetheinyl transferase
MPLYKTIQTDDYFVLVWKITESYNDLFRDVALKDFCLHRLESMNSDIHQRGFLSVRKLLETAGYTDFDLFYDENGKPHLKDGKHISITHSFDFSSIIISNQPTGIDLEQKREKIIRIARKFTDFDNNFFDKSNIEQTTRQLTAIWGVKEAIYKYHSQKGLSLKQHINVLPFNVNSHEIEAEVNYQDIHHIHKGLFYEFEDYTLVHLV